MLTYQTGGLSSRTSTLEPQRINIMDRCLFRGVGLLQAHLEGTRVPITVGSRIGLELRFFDQLENPTKCWLSLLLTYGLQLEDCAERKSPRYQRYHPKRQSSI